MCAAPGRPADEFAAKEAGDAYAACVVCGWWSGGASGFLGGFTFGGPRVEAFAAFGWF